MIVYILSNIETSTGFQELSKYFKDKIDVTYILLNNNKNSNLQQWLINNNYKVIHYSLKSKKDYFFIFFKLILFFKRNRNIEIVHTHLRDANLLGLLSSYIMNVKNRIYTRHSSTFNKVYYPNSVKYDKFCNTLSTRVISISDNVTKSLLEEGVPHEKIFLLNHGINISTYQNVDNDLKERIEHKYGIEKEKFTIGIISRLLHCKGYDYIIPALSNFIVKEPNTQIIIANFSGNYKKEVLDLLKNNNVIDNCIFISFEKDVFALYSFFDVFIHAPVDNEIEAFGQIYIESLAAKIPSIFTLSGIANEFIVDNENAIVVEHKSSNSILKGLLKIKSDPLLVEKLKSNGFISIQKFNISTHHENLFNFYKKLINDKC
ncbi:glycosyltransferase family 4 protein [Flammeovirga sp. MY04]|uniref:glycosyltransferase family 4 protein n=1 Tax=Flammeovirga sp. MY04 TaxID=1191459 RepID=UPI0008063C51|nr:glycosyltransferase family 4 protein [Flammeovirga sp. MY04]ANQ48427.1 glycosyltransferase family 4 protein [Flammeovirga sp. MY04]